MAVLSRSKLAIKLLRTNREIQSSVNERAERPVVLLSDLWIQTKGTDEEPPRLIRFEPNNVQGQYLDQLCPKWRDGFINPTGLREIVLKARQFGFSTLIEALFFLLAVNNTDTNTVVMADEAGNSETLFRKMRMFWENLPPAKQPRTDNNSARHLYFPDLRSSIQVITAGSRTAGRSRTIHNLHCSEVPFWPDPSILTGLLQAVTATGNVFFESTANGEDAMFCAQYRQAKKSETGYTTRFFAWWQHDEYEVADTAGFVREDEDVTVANKYNLDSLFGVERTNAKLLWRRNKKREPGMGTLFAQEYPGDDEEAFLVSGTRFFTEWDETRHVFLPGELEIKRHWHRFGSYDWGIGAPACFHLHVVDDGGRVLTIDEVYGADRTDPQQAADALACLKRNNLTPSQVPIYADPAMWSAKRDQTTGVRLSNVQAFFAAGLRMTQAANNRSHGWANMRRYLHEEVDDQPAWRISRACPNLIRTIPLMIRDKKDPEDLDTTIEDHAVDCARYGLAAKPRPSAKEAPLPKIDLKNMPQWYSKRIQSEKRKIM